jgi:hypothetical protein
MQDTAQTMMNAIELEADSSRRPIPPDDASSDSELSDLSSESEFESESAAGGAWSSIVTVTQTQPAAVGEQGIADEDIQYLLDVPLGSFVRAFLRHLQL